MMENPNSPHPNRNLEDEQLETATEQFLAKNKKLKPNKKTMKPKNDDEEETEEEEEEEEEELITVVESPPRVSSSGKLGIGELRAEIVPKEVAGWCEQEAKWKKREAELHLKVHQLKERANFLEHLLADSQSRPSGCSLVLGAVKNNLHLAIIFSDE